MAEKKNDTRKIVSDNRKARFNYFIESSLEAGIVLVGSEVKSLRLGHANIGEAYAVAEGGELWLYNAHISPLAAANRQNHEPLRKRKLLLKKREMGKLIGAIDRSGYTLVPLKLYFNDRGILKIELGLGKGKKAADKRETIKSREWDREKARLLRQKG
jgi:SsrA-binding protein